SEQPGKPVVSQFTVPAAEQGKRREENNDRGQEALDESFGSRLHEQQTQREPTIVGSTRRTALRAQIFRQSCTTTMNATVMEAITAIGAAIFTGIRSARSGTAINASPNPNDERMRLARNRTPGIRIDAAAEDMSFQGIAEWR